MGLGEGVTFPSIYSLFGRWTPPEERTRSISLALSGTSLGSVAALLLTPPLIVAYGWESAFYVFGAIGVVWWIVWHFLVSSSPEEHSGVSPAELALIRADAAPETENTKAPIRAMLSHPAVWAIIIAYFCSNWGAYVLSAWLPTYVYQALGVDLAAVGVFAIAPFVLGAIGVNAAGWIADGMLRRGFSIISVRKIMNSVGFSINAAVLFTIGFVTSAPLAISLLSVGTFFGSMAVAGCGTSPLDIAPRHSGTLMGISNTIATIPGIVGITLSGAILDATGSWALVFGVAGAFSIIGMVAFAALASGERIFD
jgi:ACS family sodium-dependent inorganic phosphate cotransporter